MVVKKASSLGGPNKKNFKVGNNNVSNRFRILKTNPLKYCLLKVTYPPASEASGEVANLNEIKNLHTPNMVSKNLSVCILT